MSLGERLIQGPPIFKHVRPLEKRGLIYIKQGKQTCSWPVYRQGGIRRNAKYWKVINIFDIKCSGCLKNGGRVKTKLEKFFSEERSEKFLVVQC